MDVRRLYFLELEDHIPYDDLGPYIHIYYYPEGGEQHVAYGLTDFDEVPVKPDIPFEQTQPDTEKYALWQQYNLYQAILLHENKRVEVQQEYLVAVSRYILENCISIEDRGTLTIEQFSNVYRRALCPEVGEEDLLTVLADIFQGFVEGEIIARLIEKLAGFGGIIPSNQALGNPADVGITA